MLICALALALLPSGAVQAEDGIRHRLDATVSLESDSPLIQKGRDVRGELSFSVRLSANSRESRYFGVLSPSYSDLVISDKTRTLVAPTKLWEEERCHQRRGMPKVTVTLVKGAFGQGPDKHDIWAVVRQIGLHVPSDELTPGIKLPTGVDDIGSFYALRAQTRISRINVDLKIYSFDCRI